MANKAWEEDICWRPQALLPWNFWDLSGQKQSLSESWSKFNLSLEEHFTSAIVSSTLIFYRPSLLPFRNSGYICSYFRTEILPSQLFCSNIVFFFFFLEKQLSSLKYLHLVTIPMGHWNHCRYLQRTKVKIGCQFQWWFWDYSFYCCRSKELWFLFTDPYEINQNKWV